MRVALEVDEKVRYALLRPVLAVAAAAGYPHVSFLVRKEVTW